MSKESEKNLRTVEDYVLELAQMLLDCFNSMTESDVCDILVELKDRVLLLKVICIN